MSTPADNDVDTARYSWMMMVAVLLPAIPSPLSAISSLLPAIPVILVLSSALRSAISCDTNILPLPTNFIPICKNMAGDGVLPLKNV